MTSLQTIGVVGADTMGSGIAQACAVVGLSVTIIDVDEAAVARGRNAVSSSLDRLVVDLAAEVLAQEGSAPLRVALSDTYAVFAGPHPPP